MNKWLLSIISVSLMFICTFAGEEKSKWNLFSGNMELALTNSNPGVTLAGLKLIIRFPDKLNSPDHFFNLIRQLNDSDNQQIRKAALIALYKLDNTRAIAFYEQQLDQEENEAIKKKMADIVSAYHKNTAHAAAEINNCFEICRCCNFVNLTY